LGLSGIAGFGTAIGVHFAVGYVDYTHLAPAFIGFGMYLVGLFLAAPSHYSKAHAVGKAEEIVAAR
jgi:hypothetical protein